MDKLYTLIVVPLIDMAMKVKDVFSTLISIFAILIIGIFLAKVLYDVVRRVLKELYLDKLADQVGLSGLMHKGGIKHPLSELIGMLVSLSVLVTFVFSALEVIGITTVTGLVGTVVGYVPHVITAAVVLTFGLIIAKIVSKLIYAAVGILNFPNPKLHERVSRWAIVLYVAKLTLVELGYDWLFAGTVFHLIVGGVVLALALAFGLGGKEMAAGYLAGRKKK